MTGPFFFRDTDGYYLNLAHVLCAWPCSHKGPGGAKIVAVQMTTRDIVHSVFNNKVELWPRSHFIVLEMEWERVLADARGPTA